MLEREKGMDVSMGTIRESEDVYVTMGTDGHFYALSDVTKEDQKNNILPLLGPKKE